MILVTGGTGLVGSHLLYQLTLENDAVKAIYRTDVSLKLVEKVFSYFTDDVAVLFAKIDWIKADITDISSLKEAFYNVTIVYHAAALVSFDSKDYRKMRQVNIDGTANVVNYCISNKVKKLCFVSSIAAVGDAIEGNVVSEENEWNVETNNNCYSITKYGAEMEVWRASQEGVAVIIVNPGVILGAGFWNLNTGQLFSKIANGFNYYTEGVTGFIGVKDVASAMIQLLKSDVKNKRYILVSENTSFQTIFTQIAKAFHKKPPSIKISKWITSVLWRVDFVISKITGKAQLITKDSAKSLHTKTYYSAKKIQKEIGFQFTPIQKVIKETCNSYLKE